MLDGVFEACGVPSDKFRTICSTVDKLDKTPWKTVRDEMIYEKGLESEKADKIGEYVRLNGKTELVDKLLSDPLLTTSKSAITGLGEMKVLLNYCKLFGVEKEILFDLSLARGLDYYTGVIYEAILLKDTPLLGDEPGTIGSVAGGGRYDNLVGMFDPKGKQVPCVGVSIGVERIFSILEAKHVTEGYKIRTTDVDIYVASAHKGLHEKRMQLIGELWNAGLKAEHSYKQNPKLLAQLQYCEENQIPFAVILGDSELDRGVVKLREVATRSEVEIQRENIAEEIRKRIKATN